MSKIAPAESDEHGTNRKDSKSSRKHSNNVEKISLDENHIDSNVNNGVVNHSLAEDNHEPHVVYNVNNSSTHVQINDTKQREGNDANLSNGTLNGNAERDGDVKDDVVVDVRAAEGWGRKVEFLLASIGLAVGLGNVWRFPYLCQKNGGGAFLIPYFIMMFIEGIPLFYIEFAVGQRFRRSAIGCWKRIHPALMGVGISCVVISLMLCIYYVAIIAWSFYYMFVSLTTTLPWRLEDCPRFEEYKNVSALCNTTTAVGRDWCDEKKNFSDCCVHDPQLYYFYRIALDISPGIEQLKSPSGNYINGKMVGCLILAWILVYCCIVKGVKSSGKAVYFTATFPYMILVVFFFFAITRDGASIGLKKLFTPDFSKLSDASIWMDAAAQMFFTLSLGFGALISFASYMPVKNNCVRDAFTVVLINCGTSIFAGIVVFAILGNREYVLGKKVETAGAGPALAFITFCDAFLHMPAAPLWSVLFFIMLILLGIDSEFGTLEGLITPFYDMKWVTMRKEIFTAICSIAMLILGISLVSSSGFYAFTLFDDYSVSLPLLFIAFFQVVGVSWVYGLDKFGDDVEFMTGKRPWLIWNVCWKYISPIAIFVIFIANCAKLGSTTPKYNVYVGCEHQDVAFSSLAPGNANSLAAIEYPGWAKFFVAMFIIISMLPIIIILVIHLVQHPQEWKNGFKKRFGTLRDYLPDPSWRCAERRRTPQMVELQLQREMDEDVKK